MTFVQSPFTHSPLIHGGGIRKVAAAGITSIVQQASAESQDITTITAPADINAGDLLILLDHVLNNGAAPAAVTPSGWTQLLSVGAGAEAGGFQNRLTVSYKIADGTEGSSSISGHLADDGNEKLLVTFRPDTAITAVAATNSGGSNVNTDPVAVAVNAGSETPPLLALGFYCTPSAAIDPRTFTVAGSPAKDGEVGHTSTTLYLAWKIYITSPANVSVDMDDEGNLNILAGGVLEVS